MVGANGAGGSRKGVTVRISTFPSFVFSSMDDNTVRRVATASRRRFCLRRANSFSVDCNVDFRVVFVLRVNFTVDRSVDLVSAMTVKGNSLAQGQRPHQWDQSQGVTYLRKTG